MKLSATLLGWAVAAIVDGTMAAPNPAAGASAAEPAVQPADDYSPVVRTCSTKTQLCYNQYTSVEGGVAYGIAIPQTTSGNFDVALKMVAQRRVQWAAISWGGDMVNAPLTIGWVNGRDVVVTTRYTTVWRYPPVYNGANYTILPDTGVNNTHWTLSVRCSGCTKWSAKTINPSSTAEFLALAMNHTPGSVRNPADPGSTFTMHDVTGRISFNFNNAKQANFQAATRPYTKREFGPEPRPQ